MIDAYVINLEKDVDRKNNLLKNICENKINDHIDFKLIKAVDESQFDHYTFKICDEWYDPRLKTAITKGEVGCSLSHYKCWLEFYNSNKPHCIVLEDDICFSNEFSTQFQTLLRYPEHADIVYLHRKALKSNVETNYNDDFINIKASYWTCGYLLTRKGAEQLLKANFLNNLIVVDEFLPLLYDSEHISNYHKYYNIHLIGYALTTPCILLVNNTFTNSNTFHSNYYHYDTKIVVITSNHNTTLSSIDRFIYSCQKYSLNYTFINEGTDVYEALENVTDKLIICDSNHSFFINNPLTLNNVYANFNNLSEFIEKYNNNHAYFFGSVTNFKDILNGINIVTHNLDNFVHELVHADTTVLEKGILVHGKNNVYLLNKYENYILNKVTSCYGFKLKQRTEYTFKIRVNIFIYNLNYKHCIHQLKQIDYPSELLDIHVYTNKSILIENMILHKMEIVDAYKDMYTYYKEYDYIWLIDSNNIITNMSLLKQCINTNKYISSGLHIRKHSLFSNFWGELTNTGWYKRSDDYIDILEFKKINIWNMPFINQNILINTKILDKYDLFKHVNYDSNNVDMILCENIRLVNESLYLLNDKNYGYISESVEEIPGWCEESILHKDFYDFLYNDKKDIFNEVGPDIWNIPFFTSEFCKHLITLAETNGSWSSGVYTNPGQIDTRINTVENIPTQDIHLKDVGLHAFWEKVVSTYFKKILSHLYKYVVKNYNIAFIVKYDYDHGQKSLMAHHDSSVYTINIALNGLDEYTGGGVHFISKHVKFVNKNVGHLLLHPGRITHYHEAMPITSGKRYVLVSFNN